MCVCASLSKIQCPKLPHISKHLKGMRNEVKRPFFSQYVCVCSVLNDAYSRILLLRKFNLRKLYYSKEIVKLKKPVKLKNQACQSTHCAYHQYAFHPSSPSDDDLVSPFLMIFCLSSLYCSFSFAAPESPLPFVNSFFFMLYNL